MFSMMDKESMNDVSLIVTSVFGGCLMGLFLMGFFTKKVDGFAATIAMIMAVLFNLYLGLGLLEVLPPNWIMPVHSYWVGALVNTGFIIIAYMIGLFRKSDDTTLAGLTVWTLPRDKSSE